MSFFCLLKLSNERLTDAIFRHLKASIKENESDHETGTNGSIHGLLPKGSSSYSCIEMNGKEVFRFAVRVVPHSIELALEKAGLDVSNIDWLLLHQVRKSKWIYVIYLLVDV